MEQQTPRTLEVVSQEAPHPRTFRAVNWENTTDLSPEESSSDGSDYDIMSLESLHCQYSEVCFGDLAKTVAANYGCDPSRSPAEDMMEVWHADAWEDCRFHLEPFLSTYIYEMLPSVMSGFLCWAIEGKVSAKNRRLLFPLGLRSDLLFMNAWWVLFMYVYWSPACSLLLDILIVFLLMSFRAASIAMKYAYLSDSSIRQLLSTENWLDHDHTNRKLGVSTHFNITMSFEFDVMKEILVAALRADVLQELPVRAFSCTRGAAESVWAFVKEQMRKVDDISNKRGLLDETGLRASQFGDVQKHIGLGDVDKIEREISQGKLRASILAYYFAVREYGPSNWSIFLLIFVGAILLSAVRPFVRYASEDTSDDTSAGTWYQVLLTISIAPFMCLFLLYIAYCLLDAWKRNHLCRAVLASIGHRQIRGERLMQGYSDTFLPLKTPEDVVAFWALQRVLGPELYRGLSIRYNCAYLTVTVMHLLLMFLLVLIFTSASGIEYSTAAQIGTVFIVGVILVMVTAMIAGQANHAINLVRKVLERTALNSLLRGDDMLSDIMQLVDVLRSNLEDVLPIQIFYMPANMEVVSLVLAVLGFLSHIMLKQLSKGLHVPELLLEFV